MELRHLRYVVAVAEHRHVGRAARALGIAQPPLSRQVAAVEEELGTRLFERTGRGTIPTVAGEVFVAHARRILEQVDVGAEDARRAARGQSGTLRLGIIGSALIELLPGLLARFRTTHPGVGVGCRELSSAQSTAALVAGEIDLAVCRGMPRGPGAERLQAVAVGHDQLVGICSRAHPLAARGVITVDQLRRQPLVLTTSDDEPSTVTALAELLADRDATLSTTHARDVHTIIGLAACGFGVGLLPSCARGLVRPGTALLEVEPVVPLPDLCLVHRAETDSPVVDAFLAVTAEHCPGVGSRLRAVRGRAG
ncbi:LysR family transcriptional regulator [Actinomycetospora flava]|uniref:LysR family transcriptional regulator n=1 Tax=Actinomycetospora flava TaxID=3129232 RepID=A0ABU8M8G8_9PSEU